MEARQLRYFIAVAEELNFNHAARRLHLSQPALSRAIQDLEHGISAHLVERNSRRVLLTEAGKVFYKHAQGLLAHMEQAKDEVRRMSRGDGGTLAVGVYGSAIMDLVPLVVHRFSNHCPGVRLTLHAMEQDAQVQALRERRIAVAFNRLVPEEPDIVQEVVRMEPLVVALPAALNKTADEEIELGDLLDLPLVLYPAGPRNRLLGKINELYADYGAVPPIAQEVPDAPTAIALVSAGLGLCIAPRSANFISMPRVTYHPLKCRRTAEIELVCLYRQGDPDPALSRFLEVVHGLADC